MTKEIRSADIQFHKEMSKKKTKTKKSRRGHLYKWSGMKTMSKAALEATHGNQPTAIIFLLSGVIWWPPRGIHSLLNENTWQYSKSVINVMLVHNNTQSIQRIERGFFFFFFHSNCSVRSALHHFSLSLFILLQVFFRVPLFLSCYYFFIPTRLHEMTA